MSSIASAPPLRLERRPSIRLMMILATVHGLALLVLLPLPLAGWLKMLLAAAVVAQGIVSWRGQADLSAPRAVKTLVWRTDNRWELFSPDGIGREARLLPGAYVHPWLVVLRFRDEDDCRCAVVLPPDGLDPDQHRRLRVRLRLNGLEIG